MMSKEITRATIQVDNRMPTQMKKDGHHILRRKETTVDGRVVEEHIVMWGG